MSNYFIYEPPDKDLTPITFSSFSDFLLRDYTGTQNNNINAQTTKAPFQVGETFLNVDVNVREINIQIRIIGSDREELTTLKRELALKLKGFPSTLGIPELGKLRYFREGEANLEIDVVPINSPQFTQISRRGNVVDADLVFLAPGNLWNTLIFTLDSNIINSSILTSELSVTKSLKTNINSTTLFQELITLLTDYTNETLGQNAEDWEVIYDDDTNRIIWSVENGLSSEFINENDTNFSEYTTGQTPSDWTPIWNTANTTWEVVEEVAEDVDGDQYLQNTSTASEPKIITWDYFSNVVDTEVLTKVRTTDNTLTQLGIAVRVNESPEDAYVLQLRAEDELRIAKYVNGAFTSIATATVNFNVDTWYNLRFRVFNDELKAKQWEYGTAEPETWTLEATDTDITAGGDVGFFSFTTDGIRDFDLIEVQELQETQVLQADLLGDVLVDNDSVNYWTVIPEDVRNMKIISPMKLNQVGGDFDAPTLALRLDSTNQTFYRLRHAVDLDLLVLNKLVNGTQTTLKTVDINLKFDTYYFLKFEARNDLLKAKIWEIGETEPSGWNIEVVDRDITQGSVGVGFSKFNAGATTAHYDTFTFESLGEIKEKTFFTDFSLNETGQLPEDWELHWVDAGTTFQIEEESGTTGGKILTVDNDWKDYRYLRWKKVQNQHRNVEITGRIRLDSNTTSAVGFMVLRASTNVQTGYFTWFQYFDTFREFAIVKRVDGTTTPLSGISSSTLIDRGIFYNVRFRVIGNNLKAKFWEEGTAEPAGFDVETTDDDIDTGYVGIGDFSETGKRAWDIVGVGIDGAAAPLSE